MDNIQRVEINVGDKKYYMYYDEWKRMKEWRAQKEGYKSA